MPGNTLLGGQRRLNDEELLDHCRNVVALGKQRAVGDLVADLVVLHHEAVLASFGIRVEDQGGAVLEAETGESAVLGIVEGPGAALAPVTLVSSLVDRAPACIVDGVLELSPRENEVRLTVDAELLFKTGRTSIARPGPTRQAAQRRRYSRTDVDTHNRARPGCSTATGNS